MAILAFLGQSAIFKVDLAQMTADDRTIDPVVLPGLRLLQEALGKTLLEPFEASPSPLSGPFPMEIKALPRFSFYAHEKGEAAERAVRILAQLPAKDIETIFCALVACRTGSFCDYAPSVGDRPATVAIAEVMGASAEETFVSGGGLTDDFLKGYKKAHLVKVALACGVVHENPDKLNQSQLRGLILSSPGRESFLPPELAFGTDKALNVQIEKVGKPAKPSKPRPAKPVKKSNKVRRTRTD